MNSYYSSKYSNEDWDILINSFFEAFLKNYKSLVELNFPTLKSKFKLYSLMPVSCVIDLNRKTDFLSGSLNISFLSHCSKEQSDRNRVFILSH